MILNKLFDFAILQPNSDSDVDSKAPEKIETPKSNIPSDVDLQNIIPAKLHLENSDPLSADLMQACLKFTQETTLATDNLQQAMLTYLILAATTQDELQNMTFYHIYQAIDHTLSLDYDTILQADDVGIQVIDLTVGALPEFLDVVSHPTKTLFEKIQQKLLLYSIEDQLNALSDLSLSLFQFCFAHRFLGVVNSGPIFSRHVYAACEPPVASEEIDCTMNHVNLLKESIQMKNQTQNIPDLTDQDVDAILDNVHVILTNIKQYQQQKKKQKKQEQDQELEYAQDNASATHLSESFEHQAEDLQKMRHIRTYKHYIPDTDKITEPVFRKIQDLEQSQEQVQETAQEQDFKSCNVVYHDGRYYFTPCQESLDGIFADCVNIEDPRAIDTYLGKHILGQREAKKVAATAYYLHTIKQMRQSMIFVGPSGCGKTEIFRRLSQLMPHVVYIYDTASISNDGWKGQKKYYSVFTQMLAEGWTKEEIENAIIVLDESDKMFAPKYSSGGDNVASSVQAEFLSMVEGTTLSIKNDYGDGITIDTRRMSFIFLGAFDDLRKEKKSKATKGIGFNSTDSEIEQIGFEDLIKFGLCTELAGRISRIVLLDALTENDFYTILQDPVMSPVADFAIKYREPVSISQKYLQDLSQQAIENEMGVRFMYGQIMDVFLNEVYSPGSTEIATLGSDLQKDCEFGEPEPAS